MESVEVKVFASSPHSPNSIANYEDTYRKSYASQEVLLASRYNGASLTRIDFAENNPNPVDDISFRVSGGYNCDYSSSPRISTIFGTMTIEHATVTVEILLFNKMEICCSQTDKF